MSKKNAEQSRAERAAAVLHEQESREQRRKFLVIGGLVLALVAIVVGGLLIQSNRDTSGDVATDPAGVTDTYSVVIGEESAPKTVRIYEDFQCPICADFEAATSEQLKAAVDEGTIKVEYRMVSFLDGASSTDYSSRALNAAAVVLDTSGADAFLTFHGLLYDNQPAEGSAGLSDDELIDYAVEAGADESAIRSGIENEDFSQWVVNATNQMSVDGVNGTPTVFVDGKQAGATLGDSIKAALDAAG